MTTSERAHQEPTTATVGGVTYDDPYAWLEDDTEDVLVWQESQNRRALEYIEAWPAKELLEEQITPWVADLSMTPPRKCGPYWFARDNGKAGARITVSSD